MLAVFHKLAQRARATETVDPARQEALAEQREAALALARELLRTVEQFVIATPDLDTQRFLRRLRGTAAGLTTETSADNLRLFQEWARSALAGFGALQRRCVSEREDELWRLLEIFAQAIETGHREEHTLLDQVQEFNTRMRVIAKIDDIREARLHIEHELEEMRRLVEHREREEKARTAALQKELLRLEGALSALRGQANYDALTRVFHRGVFLDRMLALLNEGKPFAIALLDLDNFRTINDTLGHHVGDRLLAHAAEQLRRVARSQDVVARFGGDEFAFLAPGASAEQLSQRLSPAVGRRYVRLDLDEDRVCSALLSFSIGLAASSHGEPSDSLLRRADGALQAVKTEGRGGMRLAVR